MRVKATRVSAPGVLSSISAVRNCRRVAISCSDKVLACVRTYGNGNKLYLIIFAITGLRLALCGLISAKSRVTNRCSTRRHTSRIIGCVKRLLSVVVSSRQNITINTYIHKQSNAIKEVGNLVIYSFGTYLILFFGSEACCLFGCVYCGRLHCVAVCLSNIVYSLCGDETFENFFFSFSFVYFNV